VVTRKDGTTIPVEVITVALPDGRGDVTGFLGIHRDITLRPLRCGVVKTD
jgi:PAS domain S-box-containing protein